MGMRGSFSSKIHVCHVEQKVERFKKLAEGAFFANNKGANSPLQRGGYPIPTRPPHREACGGVLVTVGVRSQEAVAVLTWVRWVLLRERGT